MKNLKLICCSKIQEETILMKIREKINKLKNFYIDSQSKNIELVNHSQKSLDKNSRKSSISYNKKNQEKKEREREREKEKERGGFFLQQIKTNHIC